MYADRRNFLQKLAGLAGLVAAPPFLKSAQGRSLLNALEAQEGRALHETVTDETFWYQVKHAYTVSSNILNLNNGGVSPQPRVVQEAVERYNRLSNETPSYYMWRILDQGREPLRGKLAELAGCSPEEIAIDRNSSEALETIIFGLRLKEGDEV
ncbi:MAG: aminotransferase, partial [Saprospiraceae bacterium]|nr:aminotransferase [Saprospiraceae bacterium]